MAQREAKRRKTQGKKNSDFLSFSWRDKPQMIPVTRQFGCGCCFGFVCNNCISVRVAIRDNCKPIELSHQELCNNVPVLFPLKSYPRELTPGQCYGNTRTNGFKYIRDHGVAFAHQYPYVASRGEYHMPDVDEKMKIVDFVRLDNLSDEMINTHLQQKGPISARIPIFDSFEKLKCGDVYTAFSIKDEKPRTYHSVLLVGYGQKDGVGVFEYQNTHGIGFGDGGYGLVRRDVPDKFIIPKNPRVVSVRTSKG